MKKNIYNLFLLLVLILCTNIAQSSPVSLTASFWNVAPPSYYVGDEYEVPRTTPSRTHTSEGLQFNGSGYRSGATVYSIAEADFSEGGDIYFTWKANGGDGILWGEPCTNCYMRVEFGIGWFDGANLIKFAAAERMTLMGPYAGSKLVEADRWYFSHIEIFPDKQFIATTSTDNFDDQNGTVFLTDRGYVLDEYWKNISKTRLFGSIIDSYGASNANATIRDVSFKTVTKEDTSILVAETLDFHCPIIDYQQTQWKSSFYSATFEYLGVDSNNQQLWKLKDYETVEKKQNSTVAAELYGFENNMLKVFSGKRGQIDYWADFEFIGNNGEPGALVWKLIDYGLN